MRKACAQGVEMKPKYVVLIIAACVAQLAAFSVQAATVPVPLTITVNSSAELQSELSYAPDGSVIEIVEGTYLAPSGGFLICDTGGGFCDARRSLTVRAQAGAEVILSGGSSGIIMVYKNDAPNGSDSHAIAFEDLTFANGYSASNGKSGGITLNGVNSSFTRVTFRDNTSEASSTGGGALFAYLASNTEITDSVFHDNSAKNEGGALASADGTLVITDSVFTNNSTSGENHRESATGGAVHVTSTHTGGDVLIRGTHFEGNSSGCCAGALFSTGRWDSAAPSKVRVENSSFKENHVDPHATVECAYNPVGGALHGEDNTEYTITNSRFIENSAGTGGAISLYRSIMSISQSVFLGNYTYEKHPQGFGGTIMANSNDASNESTGEGAINRRSVSLTVSDSFFQGRMDGEPSSWSTGGCIFALGDSNSMFGKDDVPASGTLEQNRAQLVITNSAFDNCDVETSVTGGSPDAGTGAGGGVSATLTNLQMSDSIIINSDAKGAKGAGGGFRVVIESDATVTRSTFANNTAGLRGGALQLGGSHLNLWESQFMHNEVTGDDYQGSAMYNTQQTVFGTKMEARGVVYTSVFSNNDSQNDKAIWDQDSKAGPINNIEYEENAFWSPFNPLVYRDNIFPEGSAGETVDGLNALVVARNSGVEATDKAPFNDNLALSETPELLAIIAVPSVLVEPSSTDPGPKLESYVVYAWDSAGDAELNGESLASFTGVVPEGVGSYTLEVGGLSKTVVVTRVPEPAALSLGLASLLALRLVASRRKGAVS
jgi:predicted outer membrane repeat protein